MGLWTIYGPLSLWSIFFLILISDAVIENVTLLVVNTTDRENNIKYEDTNLIPKYTNYSALNMLKWPNYFWFTVGFGIGVLVTLIAHFKLYCQIWCTNYRILRHIQTVFRVFRRRFVCWFRRFCLCIRVYKYTFTQSDEQQNNEVVTREQRRNTFELQTPLTCLTPTSQLPRFTSPVSRLPQPTSSHKVHVSQRPQLMSPVSQLSQHMSPVSQFPQLTLSVSQCPESTSFISRLSQSTSLDSQRLRHMSPVSQLPQPTSATSRLRQPMSPISQLPYLKIQPQFPQRVQPLLNDSQQQVSYIPQQLPVPVSEQLQVMAQPTSTTISPIGVRVTTALPTMIATSTATSSRQPLTAPSIINNPEDYINSLFRC